MSKLYTTSADFDLGFFVNTNDTTAADQVQLAPASSPGVMPIFRAPLNAQNQLVYVDTSAVAVIGRYQVVPTNTANVGAIPQTVWVDLYGNTWVGCAIACDAPFPSATGGAITKVGIIIGGTRCDNTAGFPANPNGLYLKPPFTYNSGVVDRDGDGLIRTMNPLIDPAPLPWVNVTDLSGGPDARTVDNVDDFILVFQRTTGAFACGICSDPTDESIWVGTDTTSIVAGHAANQFEQLNNYTGAIISTITPALFGTGTLARGGRCNLIDAAGVMWSSSYNGPLVRAPAPFSPGSSALITPTNCNQGQSNFSPICIDGNGKIWLANIRNPAGALPITVWRFSAAGVQEGEFNLDAAGFQFRTQAMVCRYQDNSIWGASSGKLLHVNNAGALVAPVVNLGNSHQIGVMDIDANGKVWIVDASSGPSVTNLARYNPTTHALETTLSLSATVNNNQMGMSSPMGNARLGIGPPIGFWDVVYDAGSVLQWGIISWHESVPVGSAIKVEYRIANTELELQLEAFATASNGVQFSGRTGQFVEVRVTLRAPVGSTNTPGVDAPALLDLTIQETNVPNELRLGQGGTEFLYRHVTGLTPVPVPEVRLGQAAFECLYRSSVDMRLGQGAIELLYASLLSGPPLVGCPSGLVSFYGCEVGLVSYVKAQGVASFTGVEAGQVSCVRVIAGVASFTGAEQGQMACN